MISTHIAFSFPTLGLGQCFGVRMLMASIKPLDGVYLPSYSSDYITWRIPASKATAMIDAIVALGGQWHLENDRDPYQDQAWLAGYQR